MTQAELDRKLVIARCVTEDSYNYFKRNIPKELFPVENIKDARTMVLNKAAEKVKEWTDDKILSYFDEYSFGAKLATDFFNATAYLTDHVIVNDADELMTLCMIVSVFKSRGGQDISMLLAYIIWTQYVSEHYCAQWMECGSLDDCWNRVVVSFLFDVV